MKVQAIELGYYGNCRIKPGQVFELTTRTGVSKDKLGKLKKLTLTPEQQFSDTWMRKVSEKEGKPVKIEKSDPDKKKEGVI